MTVPTAVEQCIVAGVRASLIRQALNSAGRTSLLPAFDPVNGRAGVYWPGSSNASMMRSAGIPQLPPATSGNCTSAMLFTRALRIASLIS